MRIIRRSIGAKKNAIIRSPKTISRFGILGTASSPFLSAKV
jgi:hypothetical protein